MAKKPPITELADEYARTHTDVRQAFLDGYNAAKCSRKRAELDLSFVPDDFRDVVERWIRYKKERNSSYTQSGVETLFTHLYKLSNGDRTTADAIVEQSIACNWQGLFELKNGKSTSTTAGRAYESAGQTVADRRASVAQMGDVARRVLRDAAGAFDF